MNLTKVKFFTLFTKETRHFKDFQKVSNFVTEKMRINSRTCAFPERKQWDVRHRGDLNLRQINLTLNMERPKTVKSRVEPFVERTSPMRDDTTRVRENWSKRFVERRVWKRREYLIVLAWNYEKIKDIRCTRSFSVMWFLLHVAA